MFIGSIHQSKIFLIIASYEKSCNEKDKSNDKKMVQNGFVKMMERKKVLIL